LAEVLKGDRAGDTRGAEQPMKDPSLEARLRANRPAEPRCEDERGERTPGRERFALHPRSMEPQLLADFARQVNHADLVLLGTVDEAALTKLALDSDGLSIKIEIGPLNAEALAQPEPRS
jgi:hypothetical protein